MENFIIYNPTKLHFGDEVVENLGKETKSYGKKTLLLYGKGSVVRNGYYQQVVDQLNKSEIEIIEYAGIKSNPLISDVEAAAELGRKHQVDSIVALGGGSVIDSAKIVALCIPEALNAWAVMKYRVKTKEATPILAVLTLAATGTEMNGAAVVQNPETKEKIGHWNPLSYPKHSFLDPSFTATVPEDYTAYGVVDLIAHAFESYFGKGDSPLSDRFVVAVVEDAMEFGPKLLENLTDYDYRANIMLDATCALNGILSYGKAGGDWGVHSIGHTLSVLFDTPHGASLSIAYPAWMKLQKKNNPERLEKLAKQLFGSEDVDLLIQGMEEFFVKMKSPIRLNEIGIGDDKCEEFVELMIKNNVSGYNYQLSKENLREIVDFMK